jgi:hypothetical protein
MYTRTLLAGPTPSIWGDRGHWVSCFFCFTLSRFASGSLWDVRGSYVAHVILATHRMFVGKARVQGNDPTKVTFVAAGELQVSKMHRITDKVLQGLRL